VLEEPLIVLQPSVAGEDNLRRIAGRIGVVADGNLHGRDDPGLRSAGGSRCLAHPWHDVVFQGAKAGQPGHQAIGTLPATRTIFGDRAPTTTDTGLVPGTVKPPSTW
jgi:hypothetical protein